MQVKEYIKEHKLLNEINYEKVKLHRGYTDKKLYVNLDDNRIEIHSIPEEVKEKFTGGKGYGMRFLWDAVTPQTRWNDPENEIVIAVGPVGGITQYPGAGKSLIVSLSP